MIKKFIQIFLIIITLTLFIPVKIEAAKKFVPKAKTTISRSSSSGTIPAVVRYRPDKLGILFSFSTFNGIESVNYSFTYSTNGIPQGAGGTIRSSNDPASSRELLFGTCSTSVCTYHYNLSGARLVLTARLTNGNTVTKAYRIKTYR